ncbi:TPA: hypothetical protein N0F65_010986 [Lagenidium giganteum]|uniref:Transmembrane protein n=1 Tax=Lagenidium giganteum TaxID=4803 RepID=A0AAV2Z917_9STRA|nr:TPA: hypothetical protein N0F65_010986 [Lagenidium giganteum]
MSGHVAPTRGSGDGDRPPSTSSDPNEEQGKETTDVPISKGIPGPTVEDTKRRQTQATLGSKTTEAGSAVVIDHTSTYVEIPKNSKFSTDIGFWQSWSGSISSAIFVALATCLAVSTYSLDKLANKSVNLGTIETAFDHDVWDVPVMTWLNHTTSVAAGANQTITSASYGSQSLGDLQYDLCGRRDWDCAEKVRPNTEYVYSLVASTFPTIANFELPELVDAIGRLQMQYVSQLAGFNFPVVQYFVPGMDWAVVCTVRRGTYRLGTVAVSDIDSVAMCVKRQYDPAWGCENDSDMDATVYVIKVLNGRATYLGQTKRHEVYYNPGNLAPLTGSVHGTGLLGTVASNDEYQGAVLVSNAPWDIYGTYLCKGTFSSETYLGMHWKGLGKAVILWKSSALMLTNAAVLWVMTAYFAATQLIYLPRSCVCAVPVWGSKTLAGLVVLVLACIGNYNVQVLTTFLSNNSVTAFDAGPYRLAGPLTMACIVGIMTSTVIQIYFNPHLATPSSIVTVAGIISFVLGFVLEAFVIVAQCVAIVAIVVLEVIRRRDKSNVPATNSVLRLFGTKSFLTLSSSTRGGIVKTLSNGDVVVDGGVLLSKNFVRVCDNYAVRSCNVKYAII